ncbi:MAG: DUF4238 domain-containing protein [Propionibacteriaceae bacterium]
MSARHHLVPQFYLRNFADASQQVVLVDLGRPERVIRSAIRKACAEVGFYRIETEVLSRKEDRATHDPEVIEHHLSQFERPAALAIGKLLSTGLTDLVEKDWFYLINHVALQTVRGHRWREDLNAATTLQMRIHLSQTITDERIRGWLAEAGRPSTADEVEAFRAEMLGPKGPKLVLPDVVMIQESIKLALGSLGERLAGMTLSLLTGDTVPVLTSDEPVCWWSPGDGPVGYATAKVVWLPLNPRVILQLRDHETDFDSLGLPPRTTAAGRDDLVRLINSEVAGQAHRWIIHHPDDQPLEGLRVPTRTAWGDQLINVTEDGDTRRELWVHRRLPEQQHEDKPAGFTRSGDQECGCS